MLPFAQAFLDKLDEEGLRYTEKEDSVVKISFRGNNLSAIDVFVFFEENGDPVVQLKCWSIANFKSNLQAGLEVCNALNCKYRWVKFYIDKDYDVVACVDSLISDEEICGTLCLFLVRRMINILDEAYPAIAKARWS